MFSFPQFSDPGYALFLMAVVLIIGLVGVGISETPWGDD